ncbi:serine/threonine protein kinase, partial [Frankia sp. AgB32]|nr:serine/threonine protein kinase [Frankia sp. AgB32]
APGARAPPAGPGGAGGGGAGGPGPPPRGRPAGAAVVLGTLCAQLLFPSDRATGVVVTILAAFAGAGSGTALARAADIGGPGRTLSSVAGSLLAATTFAFAMRGERSATSTGPATTARSANPPLTDLDTPQPATHPVP